ncbi:phage coat protein [Salmonella enterica subsp. enterica serovar Amager]|nr:phage coat protein [Salmonella enterica subsp. enterica serovar Amager]
MNKLMVTVKNKAATIFAGVGLCVMSGAAMAADDADAGMAAFTALKTSADAYIAQAWVIFGVIVGASVAMKLVKKFINKAS